MRLIIILHRYMAVAVGLLMTLWCLSGFVMMYQGNPTLGDDRRLTALEPLDFSGCCDLSALPAGEASAAGVRVEMLRGDPVLRGAGGVTNLRSGTAIDPLSDEDVLDVARQFGAGLALAGAPRSLGIIDVDQWTIQSARRNRPVHHLAFDDPAHTEIYINGSTGEVFQATTRRERVLGWLGVVPHWLYPTLLRQNGPLWTQVVIWSSVVGVFLTATGLYLGISFYRTARRTRNRASLFRGWWYWHHMLGLVFGVLTLTWVFSGLMTMNPWGLLEGGRGAASLRQVSGAADWTDMRRFLETAVAGGLAGQDIRRIQPAPFNGQFHVLAMGPGGARQRLDVSGQPSRVTHADVEAALARQPVPVRSLELMAQEDSYYYGHKRVADLPVFRAILDDAEATRLYINPETGAVRAVGSTARTSRWVRTGLHGLDFAGLRVRPVWDIVVILLLAGVTAVCVTGTWMALKRVRMDYRRFRGR